MADIIAILIRGQLKNLALIIIFDVNTLYIHGYSFMLLLMAADSSKVSKKSIGVSKGLIQIRTDVGPYLEPNCLQRLSADNKVALSMINL